LSDPVSDLGFVHRYEPPRTAPDSSTLLLLHGTGGDEHDLIPLGALLDPAAGMLSPRGKVLEGGMPRFFRRIREGVFDVPDLIERTHELAEFVGAAAAHYKFDGARVVGVGFSNGANIAASLLLLRPRVLWRAALFSPMVPFVPDTPLDLTGTRVFIGAGRNDPIARPESALALAELLRRAGAQVTLSWHEGGHALTPEEVTAAREWLEEWKRQSAGRSAQR